MNDQHDSFRLVIADRMMQGDVESARNWCTHYALWRDEQLTWAELDSALQARR